MEPKIKETLRVEEAKPEPYKVLDRNSLTLKNGNPLPSFPSTKSTAIAQMKEALELQYDSGWLLISTMNYQVGGDKSVMFLFKNIGV